MTIVAEAGQAPVRKMTHQEFVEACQEFGESWGEKFFIQWDNGGNRCDCWGGNYGLPTEDEQDLQDMDQFLEKYFPHLTYLQYKRILREVEEDNASESDWYGGVAHYKNKTMHFQTLEDLLIEMNVLEII